MAEVFGQFQYRTPPLAVFQEELIKSYRPFLDTRRADRPAAEYREPTEQEWDEFQKHFELRKAEVGICGRPYGTPCAYEHACIRCPMFRVTPSSAGVWERSSVTAVTALKRPASTAG